MLTFRKILTLLTCFTVLVMFSLAYAGDGDDCAAKTTACPKTCPHMKKAETEKVETEVEESEATVQTAESTTKKNASKTCVSKGDPGCAPGATASVHTVSAESHGSGEECTYGVKDDCIQAFHEAMSPACHEYIPQGDMKKARADVAVMVKTAKDIAKYTPGCTYGKNLTKRFMEKREYFIKSMAELEKAAKSGNDKEFKKAFDKMHSAYAEMNGTLYLRPEAVGEFHTILASIWHEHLPAKDYGQIKATTPDLVQRAEKLTHIQLDDRLADNQEPFNKAASQVYKCAQELENACSKDDPKMIAAKVEELHNSYNELTATF